MSSLNNSSSNTRSSASFFSSSSASSRNSNGQNSASKIVNGDSRYQTSDLKKSASSSRGKTDADSLLSFAAADHCNKQQQQQTAASRSVTVVDNPFQDLFYRQASIFLPLSPLLSAAAVAAAGANNITKVSSKSQRNQTTISSAFGRKTIIVNGESTPVQQSDERKAGAANVAVTPAKRASVDTAIGFSTVWNSRREAVIHEPTSNNNNRTQQQQQSVTSKLMSQLLVYDKRNTTRPSISNNGSRTPSKEVHISQAICKVKDPGGFDCYGFLFALPIPPGNSLRYGLMTLSSFNMGQRTKKSLNLLVHFEASYRQEKPLEIPFTKWICCKKMGVSFFQLPDEAAEYVQYKRLEFLEIYRGKLVQRQKVMALQNRNGAKTPQCVVGEIVQVGVDGYFKHKISSLSGLPILDPLSLAVIGIQKGADFTGNELAVTIRAVLNEMAPNKLENWTEADQQQLTDDVISKRNDDNSTSGAICSNIKSSEDDVSSLANKNSPQGLSSRIRIARDHNFELIRNSKLIPEMLKDEICEVVIKYYLTAEELALKSELDLRLLFPRRELQDAVFAWKRSIQIDCWRREKLPIEAERLHHAVRDGDIGLVKSILFNKNVPPGCRPMLVEHRDVGDHKNTPLLQAALRGNAAIVQFLIRECNANVYAKDGHELESLPIHLAAAYGHYDTVAALLEHRHDLLEAKNRSNDTPLNRAAARGRLLVAQFLVDKKFANIENRGEFGRTPLMMAAAWGHLPVVEFLRERGADVYVKDAETGSTAIHLAAYFGQANVVKFLIERYPDLTTCKNKFGKTPWARAKEVQKKNVMNVLQGSKGPIKE